MSSESVPWRRAVVTLVAVAVGLTGIVLALRADGFDPVDATVPRATRWFVDHATGRLVLADGFAGKALARLDTDAEGDVLEVAQSASGVAVIDRSAATARTIDASALRLGPPQSLSLAAEPTAMVGVGQTGIVAVDPPSAQALLLPPGGDAVPFDLRVAGSGEATRIAPDGAVWTIAAGALSRITSTGRQSLAAGLSDARISLIGNEVLLLDAERGRVRLGAAGWVSLPDDVPVSEVVLQEPGPAASCGWLGADDRLWCVGREGMVREVKIDGLDVDGADRLAIAGDAAALVRRAPAEIVRIDWRAERVLDDVVASVPAGSDLRVAASVDLVWVDQADGGLVWAVHPWGINAIDKDDRSSPLLGESGEVLDAGGGGDTDPGLGDDELAGSILREPDDNGIDDPPVAVDDPVTARTGSSVPVAVTANDYDPDGEAIVLFEVGDAAHGTVEIGSATTAIYQPESGYVGIDQFDYTIVDGNGTEASATVTIELLPVGATNQAPVGAPDVTETGPDAAVVVDVLLNDIDPERDSLRVASFTPPDVGGSVTETVAPSGLPGLRFVPPRGASGTATFTYRPVDSFGAVGEPVPVRVEIAQPSDENRPPLVRPDAVRLRHDIPTVVPVLANDRDPDGDDLRLGVVEPLPPGLEVSIRGAELLVTARAGAAELAPFDYTVDDGRGHIVTGNVLVAVIAVVEPNRPPIANADSASAVVGTSQLIDVLVNDSDPDGDPLILLDVGRDADAPGDLRVQGDQVRYTAAPIVTDDDVAVDRFTYRISDGNGHEAVGEVTVRVLPEPIAAPPFAKDDSATTEVDVPVTLDVLRNDGDPSGERPTLLGTPGCAGGGAATVTADSRVTFRPPPGRAGVFSCRYEVTNSQGLRASATIVVSVLEPEVANIPPVVIDEEFTIELEERLVVDVLANDDDPDGDRAELRVLSSTTPTLGRAERDDNLITFDAGPVVGAVAITYQVGDVNGGVSTGRLVIRIVEPDPEPPSALDDRRTIVGPGVPTTIDVLANDADPDGESADLVLSSASLDAGDGEIVVAGREVTFLPDPDFVGDLIVTYEVADADGLTDVGRAVLTVLEAPNRAPIAVDDVGEVVNGGTLRLAIALNDSDPDGDPLAYSITAPPDPTLGTAALDGGQLVFVAEPGASGVAVVGYRVDDGEDLADASVRIDVLPCAVAPPDAPDVFLQTGYEQPIAIDLTTVARNGEIVEVGAPLSAPSGVYTPPPGENGNVAFVYVVRNACRIQDVGEVVIDVNQDPVFAPYIAQVGRIDPVVIPVTALASDAEPLRIVALEGAPEWMAVVDEQRGLMVDPAGRTGRTDIVAVVADPGGLQVGVPVAIELVNLAPVANPDQVRADTGSVVLDVLANDSDPDGDPISLASVPETIDFPGGGAGTVQRLGNDELRIDPGDGTGVATFQYTVVDSLGLLSAPTTVTVTVNGPPDAPDVEIVVEASTTVDVTVPATDPEDDPLTLEILSEPDDLTIEVDGLVLTITPGDVLIGQVVTLPYAVADPLGASATGSIEIEVTAPPTTTTTSTTSTTSTTVPATTTVPPTTTTTTTTTTSSTTTTSTVPPSTTTTPTTAPPTTTTTPTTVPPTTSPPTTAPP